MSDLSSDVKKMIEEIARDENYQDFVITTKNVEFAGDNFMGEISKIIVSNGGNKKFKRNLNLILKQCPHFSRQEDKSTAFAVYKSEINAYKNVLPVLCELQASSNIPNDERFRVPKFYKANTEENKQAIVLNDLSSEGYIIYDRRLALDYEHAYLAVKYLARLHATSLVLKTRRPEIFTKVTENIFHSFNYGDKLVGMVNSAVQTMIPFLTNPVHKTKVEEYCKDLGEKLHRMLDATTTHPYNVICHGDCWIANMLFRTLNGRLDDVIFVDWQITRVASPVTDLAYLIFLSTDQEFRKEHLTSLFEVYYETLESSAKKMGCDVSTCYPKHIFEQHKKEVLPFGFLMGILSVTLALRKKGEEEGLVEIMDQAAKGALHMKVSEEMKSRMNGLCEDFVDMNII